MRSQDAMGLPNNRKQIGLKEAETIFEKVYATNHWKKGDGSGKDSDPHEVHEFFPVLTNLLQKYEIKTFVDYGCGSHKVFSEYDFPDGVLYKGYDASAIALERAKKNARNETLQFERLGDFRNLTETGDMIMLKDVICHWQLDLVSEFIEHCSSLFKHILIVGAVTTTECDIVLQNTKEKFYIKSNRQYGIYLL